MWPVPACSGSTRWLIRSPAYLALSRQRQLVMFNPWTADLAVLALMFANQLIMVMRAHGHRLGIHRLVLFPASAHRRHTLALANQTAAVALSPAQSLTMRRAKLTRSEKPALRGTTVPAAPDGGLLLHGLDVHAVDQPFCLATSLSVPAFHHAGPEQPYFTGSHFAQPRSDSGPQWRGTGAELFLLYAGTDAEQDHNLERHDRATGHAGGYHAARP